MRKPDYISTEQTRYQPTTIEKIESDIGFHVKKKMNVDDMYMDKDSQIRAIEKTFDDAREPIEKHHSKANVFAVEEYTILPDSDMWKYPCAQVINTIQPNLEHRKYLKKILRLLFSCIFNTYYFKPLNIFPLKSFISLEKY